MNNNSKYIFESNDSMKNVDVIYRDIEIEDVNNDDMNYSKTLLKNPKGIVAKFEPITGPIITLVYNLVIGGIIGVAGSICYFLAIRNYVMEHKPFFASLDAESI